VSEENENRNPGHHSQKWYHRHPEAKRPVPTNIDKNRQPISKLSIWNKCWSWTVVGVIDALLWGGAFTFMTSGFIHWADSFYLSASILLVAKFVTWEDAKAHKRKFVIYISFALLIGCICISFILANHHFTIAGFDLWKVKSKDARYIPPPQGRLVRFDGQAKPNSTGMQRIVSTERIECLCPHQVDYELSALPTPSDNNYSTQVDIKSWNGGHVSRATVRKSTVISGEN